MMKFSGMKKGPAGFSIATGGEAAGARPKAGYRSANKKSRPEGWLKNAFSFQIHLYIVQKKIMLKT